MQYAEDRRELERYGGRLIKLADITGASANGDTKSNPHFVLPFKEADFYLIVTKSDGTTPTLDAKVIKKHPGGDKWEDVVSFTQVTGSNTNEVKEASSNIGERIAVSYTIGGTSPVYDFSIWAVVKVK